MQFCGICPVHGKIDLKWPQMGPGFFSPTNPDRAVILGITDFDFENLYFWDLFGFQAPSFAGTQISRSSEIWPGPGLGRTGLRWALFVPPHRCEISGLKFI